MSEIRDMLRVNLKKHLNRSNYNQKEFAELIGVNPASVSFWLNGKNSPDIETIAKICDALNIKFSDLISYPKEIMDIKKTQLIDNFEILNDVGKAKLLEYSEDLINLGKYTISPQKEKHA